MVMTQVRMVSGSGAGDWWEIIVHLTRVQKSEDNTVLGNLQRGLKVRAILGNEATLT